jgi:hypothetical protein
MTEQYLPCNINYTCGGGGASPQWLPPFTALDGGYGFTQNGIQNDGTVGTVAEPIILGATFLGASATGWIDVFSESDDFTLEIGTPLTNFGTPVPVSLAATITLDSILTINATTKRLGVTCAFSGGPPAPNTVYAVPVYCANGNPASDSAHREFVGYIYIGGILA